MQPFFEITTNDITQMLGYVGQLVNDAKPILIVLLAVGLGVVVVNAIVNLF
jgi:hypothetical protein